MEKLAVNPSTVVRDPARLAALRSTGLLDAASEESFDRLTRLAAKLTGAPVTFISLVDETRDFYISCYGFPEPLASNRELTGTTFCHHAIQSSEPLIIEDTLDDSEYRRVPTVSTLGVRAYLGIPLRTSQGAILGSFCAIDFAPKRWTTLEVEVMRELAASTMREIELRSAMEAAQIERSRLKVLLEQIPAGVVFAEAGSGRIVMGNRQVEAILGHPVLPSPSVEAYGEWVGFHADGRRIAPEEWPLARAIRGEVVSGEEVLYQRADGRKTWIRIHGAPVHDGETGEVLGGVVAFNDVHAQRAMLEENQRLYEEAQLANRGKDEFFAAVTHELRTPMTSILGWARLLRMEELDNPTAREAAEAIEGSARLQAKLVDDLLDVARISSGRIRIDLKQIDINQIIREVAQTMSPDAEQQGLRLRLDLGEVPPLRGDRSRLQQVLGNLVANSLKFTPAGGLIEISTVRAADQVLLTVSDTGRGIDPELLPYIFDRHRQAIAGEKGGLGLGLTIVKHLVEMHGGRVRAESEGPGRGARFLIELPLLG